MNSEGTPKITDFGMAIEIGSKNTIPGPGSPPYAAPEQYENSLVLPHCDVHALGVIAWEIISRIKVERYFMDSVAATWDGCPDPRMPPIIVSSMNRDPNKRPGIEVLAHALANIKNQCWLSS